MPWAHTLRRWLWRANAVLALGVLAVWAVALLDDPDTRPRSDLPRPQGVIAPTTLGPDISYDEMVALARPFHGWGERRVRETPTADPAPSDGLPLRAFELRLWISDPTGPDSIVLIPKDTAQSEVFRPMEGQPDQGVAIERIEHRGTRAYITVSRGEERVTFPVVDVSVPTVADGRVVRVAAPPATRGATEADALAARPARQVDVKVLPFFGRDGRVAGARVTGVRPGSAFERAGLRPGDVILGVNEQTWSGIERCRSQLAEESGVRAVRIRSSTNESTREVLLDS